MARIDLFMGARRRSLARGCPPSKHRWRARGEPRGGGERLRPRRRRLPLRKRPSCGSYHQARQRGPRGKPRKGGRRTRMKRRQFLEAAGVGLAATAVAKPAIAQSTPEIKWRLSSGFPKSLDTIYGGAETIAKYVGEASDGKFQIQPFAAGEIVGTFQLADAVSNGTVEMGQTASYYYVGKDPTFAFPTAIPWGLN